MLTWTDDRKEHRYFITIYVRSCNTIGLKYRIIYYSIENNSVTLSIRGDGVVIYDN